MPTLSKVFAIWFSLEKLFPTNLNFYQARVNSESDMNFPQINNHATSLGTLKLT